MKLGLWSAVLLAAAVVVGTVLFLKNPGTAASTTVTSERSASAVSSSASGEVEIPTRSVPPERTEDSPPIPESQGTAKASNEPPDRKAKKARVGTIRGRVVDPQGRPVESATIGFNSQKTTSNAQGEFHLEVPFPDINRVVDRRPLRIRRAGYGGVDLVASLEAGQVTDLGDVALRAAGAVSGQVVSKTQMPMPEAEVAVEIVTDEVRGTIFKGPHAPLARGSVDAAGRFRIDDVPVGTIRIWAGAEGHRWSSTGARELRVGEELHDLILELAPLLPEDTLSVIVVDPEGHPAPFARIRYRYSAAGRSGSGGTSADQDGRFLRFLQVPAEHWISAVDREQMYRPAVAPRVPPGTRDLILQLGAPAWLDVLVQDADAGTVADYQIELHDVASEQRLPIRQADGNGPAEPTRLPLPTTPFVVVVDAVGFEELRLGPLDPDHLVNPVVITLQPLPFIEGKVTTDGRPLENARVTIHEAVGEADTLTVNGFPCRSSPHAEASTKSDEAGRFRLTLREAGLFFIRAQASGLTPAELGPLDLHPEEETRDLQLDLGLGGTLQVSLRTTSSEPISNRVIGVSRGDGFGYTKRTNLEGSALFPRLTPGPWLAKVRQDEIRSGSTTSSRSGGHAPGQLPFNCHIVAGQVSSLLLDAEEPSAAQLTGHLLLGGEAAAGWRLQLDGTNDNPGPRASTTLDLAGAFRLAAPRSGAFQLLIIDFGNPRLPRVHTDVTLDPGRQEWVLDLRMGELTGRVPAGFLVGEDQLYCGVSQRGIRWNSDAVIHPDGTFTTGPIPAGRVSFKWQGEYYHYILEEGEVRNVSVPP